MLQMNRGQYFNPSQCFVRIPFCFYANSQLQVVEIVRTKMNYYNGCIYLPTYSPFPRIYLLHSVDPQ